MGYEHAPATSPDAHLIYDAFRAAPVGIALEDLEGRLVFVNAALCEMLGFSEEELRNKHCIEFSPPEDAEKDWALFQQLRAGSINHYHIDKRYFRGDGSLIWGRLSISLLNGTPPLVVAIVEDITTKKTTEEALLSRLEFESLLSELSRTFISLPENEVDANIEKGLARIAEFLKMDRITLYEFSQNRREMAATYSWNAPGVRKTPRLITAGGAPWWRDRVLHGEATLISQLTDLPEEAFLEREFLRQRGVVSAAAIPLEAGREINGVMIFVTVERQVSWTEDLTNQLKIIGDVFWNALKRKRGMEALLASQLVVRESEERLRLAARAGKMYAFDWDVVNDVIVRSEESTHIFGLTDESAHLPKHESLLKRVHPGDRARFINSLAECTPERPNTQIDYRVLRPDGSVVWLERTGHAFFDEQGKMVRMIGMVADITQRKLAEETLQEYERAVEGAGEMIVVVDREYRYRIVNNEFLKMRNMTREQVVGRFAHEVLNKGVFESAVKEKLDECFQGKVVRYEMKYTYPELGERDILVSYFPIEGATGIDRVACIVRDITERKVAEQALSTVSQKLIEAQEEERTRIARELHDDIGQRVALLAVNLEGLKDSRAVATDLGRRLGEANKQVADLAKDIQALSHRLHSTKLEYLGLAAAATGFCREFSDAHNVAIDFHSENVTKDLRQEVSICLFRVLQEAVQNATKHSGSRQFQVSLKGGASAIELTVHDSGLGFHPEEAIKGRGLGLTSMRERLKLVNGNLSIESQLQRGTTIRARVPFHRTTKSAGAVG